MGRQRHRRDRDRQLQAPGQRERRFVLDDLAVERDRDVGDADAVVQRDLPLPGSRHRQAGQRRLLRVRPDVQGGPLPEHELGGPLRRDVDDVVERERARRQPSLHQRGRGIGVVHRIRAEPGLDSHQDDDQWIRPGLDRRLARGDHQPARRPRRCTSSSSTAATSGPSGRTPSRSAHWAAAASTSTPSPSFCDPNPSVRGSSASAILPRPYQVAHDRARPGLGISRPLLGDRHLSPGDDAGRSTRSAIGSTGSWD